MNIIIKRIAKNITDGFSLGCFDFEEKMLQFNIVFFERLREFIVLTKYYYNSNFGAYADRQKQLKHTETCLVPRSFFTNYGRWLRRFYDPCCCNELPSSFLDLGSLFDGKNETKKWCAERDKHEGVSRLV